MKLYKFNKTLLLFIMGWFVMSSCDDRLELEPQQSVLNEVAFADANASLGSLLGTYSRMQQYDVFGSFPQIIADLQSDNVTFIGSFPTINAISLYTTQPDNGSISTMWRRHYEVVNNANNVIVNVPNVEDSEFDEETRTQYVAEARFIRALIFQQLVNLFAQPIVVGGPGNPGIPIVLEPFEGEIELPSRNTVGEVNDFIESELLEVIGQLPESYGGGFGFGRATAGAARALLARQYLYTGNYAEAAQYANDVINGGVNSLAPDYGFWQTSTGPEYVFHVTNSTVDNGATGSGGWASYYNPAENSARGDCPYSQYLIDAFAEEPNDLRFNSLTQVGDNGQIYTTKFPDPITDSDNAPVIRTTEMYLTRAEALVRSNPSPANQQLAIDLINPLRDRAGLGSFTLADFASADELLEAISDERRKELCFEGHRRMDLLRLNQNLRPAGDARFSEAQAGADKTILPIPQRELDINQNLAPQNPGY